MEQVRAREKEAEPEPDEMYRAAYGSRKRFNELQEEGPFVIPPPPFRLSPQGFVANYLKASDPDVPAHDWWVFVHQINGVSGRHTHQGGLVLFILEGTGYTTMNGVRYDWKEGDLVLMPCIPGGIEHQHFNLTPNGSAKWLAFIHIPTWDELGSELTQAAVNPEWAAANGVTEWNNTKVATEQVAPLI